MKTEQYDLPGEEWKWIKGWENVYALSTFGRYKSFARKKPYYSFGGKNSDGYLQIALRRNGKIQDSFLMHDLIAETFLRDFDHKNRVEIVHHLNGNKQDNRLQNLRIERLDEHTSHHHTGMKGCGGGRQQGFHLSQQTKRKMSEAKKGANNPMFGKKHSQETKAKMKKPKRHKQIMNTNY